eukprot:2467092-Prymnesium_polylepis.1
MAAYLPPCMHACMSVRGAGGLVRARHAHEQSRRSRSDLARGMLRARHHAVGPRALVGRRATIPIPSLWCLELAFGLEVRPPARRHERSAGRISTTRAPGAQKSVLCRPDPDGPMTAAASRKSETVSSGVRSDARKISTRCDGSALASAATISAACTTWRTARHARARAAV